MTYIRYFYRFPIVYVIRLTHAVSSYDVLGRADPSTTEATGDSGIQPIDAGAAASIPSLVQLWILGRSIRRALQRSAGDAFPPAEADASLRQLQAILTETPPPPAVALTSFLRQATIGLVDAVCRGDLGTGCVLNVDSVLGHWRAVLACVFGANTRPLLPQETVLRIASSCAAVLCAAIQSRHGALLHFTTLETAGHETLPDLASRQAVSSLCAALRALVVCVHAAFAAHHRICSPDTDDARTFEDVADAETACFGWRHAFAAALLQPSGSGARCRGCFVSALHPLVLAPEAARQWPWLVLQIDELQRLLMA
jgi:hypothetical protein